MTRWTHRPLSLCLALFDWFFFSILQKVEEQERLDENTTITKNVKTAKGRKTVKKIAMEDSMPSPMGRRVEPRIDPALRQKSEAAAKKLLKMKVSA